ncbi:MAG: TolC family protein [Acidobacteria bacterium]|nr:TolC family protein [Acidobacteriota bacterium]
MNVLTRSLVVALFAAASLAAEEPRPTSSDMPLRVGVFGEYELSLKQAVEMALENNLDLELTRLDQDTSFYNLTAAKGAFDPRLGFGASAQRQVSAVSSSLGGGSEPGKLLTKNLAVGPQLGGLLPWTGGSLEAQFTSSRISTDNTFATLNPQIPTNLRFDFTQPLWRGLRIDDNRRRIAIAKRNQTLSDEAFRMQAIETVTLAVQAYWNLYFAARNVTIQREALELARHQVDSNTRMFEQGVLAAIDVVEAETQAATFEQSFYTAQQNLTVAENQLKTILLPDFEHPDWGRAWTPITRPDTEAPLIIVSDAVHTALEHRPELDRLRLSDEINEVDKRYYRDQTKPQIDFNASYAAAGLAGTALTQQSNPFTGGFADIFLRLNELSAAQGLPPIEIPNFGGGSTTPPFLLGSFSQSFSNLYNRRFPTAAVGLSFSFPIRNRTAEANLGSAMVQAKRIQAQKAQLEQQIAAQVRNALQRVQSSQLRLQSAQRETGLAERQHESEQRKLQAGASTVFLALQRQTQLASARNREAQAEAELNTALADLYRATATTLEEYSVELR